MPSEGFDTTPPVSEWPQNLALDRTTAGIGSYITIRKPNLIHSPYMPILVYA